MTPYHSQHNVTIYCDDCVTAMQNMEDNSIDAIVTDPPYGLSKQPDIAEVLRHWLAGDDYEHTGGGFMGRAWDSFVPGPSVWKECLRVLKPGGHLLAFAGTRTVDLMGISLRLGGFEIRDTITNLYDTNRRFQALWETLDTEQRKLFHQVLDTDGLMGWGFGSGFPKSLDIGKAVDKIDATEMRRERQLKFTKWMRSTGLTANQIDKVTNSFMGSHYTTHLTQPAIPTRDYFEKLRSHIKIEVPDWVERLIDERTVESENFKRRDVIGQSNRKGKPPQPMWGEEDGQSWKITAPATPEAKQWDGFGTGLKPALEPVLLCRKPISEKNIAANVLRWGTGGLAIDKCRVETEENLNGGTYSGQRRDQSNDSVWQNDNRIYGGGSGLRRGIGEYKQPSGRFPANLIIDDSDEVRELFPEARSSGNVKPTSGGHFTVGSKAEVTRIVYPNGNPYRDSGSAARFFYTAKASKAERNAGLEEGITNGHPCVKPLSLMRYLCRLITPPNGLILDPFAGSGSTLIAAREENFKAIGVELEEDYCQIAVGRLSQVQPNLFNVGD